jgi:hypothetical protein
VGALDEIRLRDNVCQSGAITSEQGDAVYMVEFGVLSGRLSQAVGQGRGEGSYQSKRRFAIASTVLFLASLH